MKCYSAKAKIAKISKLQKESQESPYCGKLIKVKKKFSSYNLFFTVSPAKMRYNLLLRKSHFSPTVSPTNRRNQSLLPRQTSPLFGGIGNERHYTFVN